MDLKQSLCIFMIVFMLSSVSVGSLPMVFAAAPNSPTGLFENGESTTTTIPLKWVAPAGGDAPTGYKIEGALESPGTPPTFGSFTTLVTDTGDVTTHTITGLSAGQFYKLRIIAFNGDGTSSPSMIFMQGTAFGEGHNFSEAKQDFQKGTYSGPLNISSARTTATAEWADVFADLGITSVSGFDHMIQLLTIQLAKTIYADFTATTSWQKNGTMSLFTDANG